MRIDRVDVDDAATLRRCHEVALAAYRVDDPLGRPSTPNEFTVGMSFGWDGEPREIWTAADDEGAVIGWLLLELPDRHNRHRADLDLMVRPQARGHGTGRALLTTARERAAAYGRTTLSAHTWEGTAGAAFARAAGATHVHTEIRRVQVLAEVPQDRLARLRAQAEEAAAGYSLLTWGVPVPEEHIPGMIEVLNAFADAPRSAGCEPPAWDAERIRTHNKQWPRLGMRGYQIVARHDATGELAARTVCFVDPGLPEWASQGDTVVARGHRGHRLGLLCKVAMLELLAKEEPQLERVETWNAESNSHMIAINEALGYRVWGPRSLEWELPVMTCDRS